MEDLPKDPKIAGLPPHLSKELNQCLSLKLLVLNYPKKARIE